MPRAEGWLWGYFLANAAGGAASLLVPLYAYHLGGTATDVGALASTASFAGILGSVIWGRAADRVKLRRTFVVTGFWGFGFFYLFLPFIHRVFDLFWLNALATFLWMSQATVATLLVLENYPKADWETGLGRFNRYAGLGWMVGLGIGAFWTGVLPQAVGEGWALRSLGVITALLGLGAGAAGYLFVPEPRLPRPRRTFIGTVVAVGNFLVERFRYAPARIYYRLGPLQIVRILQGKTKIGPDLTLYFYGALLAATGFSVFFVPLPLYLRAVLGVPNGLVFALYILHNGMNAFSYTWARKLILKIGHRPVLGLALFVRTVIFPLFALLSAPPGLHLVLVPVFFLITGATWAFFQLSGTAIVSRLAPVGSKGEAMGIYNALLGLSTVFGALIGGFLSDNLGYVSAFIAAGALIFIALPIVLLESKPIYEEITLPTSQEPQGS